MALAISWATSDLGFSSKDFAYHCGQLGYSCCVMAKTSAGIVRELSTMMSRFFRVSLSMAFFNLVVGFKGKNDDD